MKQKLFGAAAMVAFILFGASCSNQEQSEFDLSSVTQEVVISATVTYSTGVDENATSYSIINSKPAAGRKVFIEVPYTEYTNPGAAGAGAALKIFETITDENGAFTITIPTRSEGINAVIRMEEFTDFYRTYEKMGADGKPVFKIELKNYSFSTPIAGLKPGAFKFPEEIVYNSQKIDVDQFDESVTMTGNVKLAIETAYRKGDFKPANKANVEFTIVYDAGTAAAQEFKFGTTTDAQGNYSITLPVKSLSSGFNISGLKVLGIGDNKFTHYNSDSTNVTIYGAYELLNFGNVPVGGSIAFRDIIDGTTYNLGSQNLLFTPYFNANITDASQAQPENWDPNLIGWAAGMPGFDESFDKTTTLTGRVFMPALASFGKGIYKPSEQSIIITGNAPYNVQFTAITDKNGYFSIDIPVKDDNDPGFAIEPKDPVQPFTFIDSKGQSTVYRKGDYEYKTKVRKDDAEWYEFGNVYFKYNVDGDERTDEWNDHLIGWYVDPEYTDSVKVLGKIKFANEQSYGVGIYEDHNVIVTVRDVTNNRYFAIQTNNGTYDFYMPVRNKNSELNLVLFGANYKTYEFKHYPKYGEGYKLLEGTYTVKSTVYDSKDAKDAWYNLGTKYMTITEAGGMDSNCDTYHDNLSGWLVRKDANDVRMALSKTAKGVVKLAEETAYLEGKMSPAKNMLIPVKIDNDQIYVLTDNAGKISLDVYFKNQGDEPGLTVPAAPASDIEFEEFKHYVNPEGKTKILSGTYSCEQVKSDEADWNDWGTIYYKFTPTDVVDNWDDYTKYISAWIYKKDFDITKTVTGTAKIAKETAYLKGNYQTEQGIAVKIQLDADPNLIFIAKTDAQGKFSIDVPVEKEDDEPNVTVLGLGTGFVYEGFTHYVNAEGKTKSIDGKYKGKQIVADDAEWNDAGTIYYTFYPDAPATVDNWNDYGKYIAGWVVKEGYDINKTVTGTAKVAQETGYLKGDYNKSAKDIAVKIQLDGDPDLIFVTTTDAQGKFSITVPVEDEDDEPVVTVLNLATGFEEEAFVHYANAEGKTKSLNGTYKGKQVKVEDAEWNDAGTLYYTFTPETPASVENWNTYGKYIAGWVVKEGYTINKNVTGAAKVAQETGFIKGDYNKSAKDIPVKIQLDADPDLIFVTTTDAQGKFSFVVPVEKEDDEPAVAVLELATGFEAKDFIHYVDAQGKTKTLKGTYKGNQIVSADAEWNDAGTIYYTFNPDNAATIEYWNDYSKYTAGWIYKDGYNISKNVTGTVKIAQETGYLLGEYKLGDNIPVKIQLYNDPDLTFAAITDGQGKFTIPVLLENDTDEPNVDVLGLGYGAYDGFDYKKFTHYVDATGKTKSLDGKYKGEQLKDEFADWNDAGLMIYKFFPNNDVNKPAEWETLTKYTAGWTYKKGYNIIKNVTGTVKIAQETGYIQGDFEADAQNTPIKVQVVGDAANRTYVVPAGENGLFTIGIQVEDENDEPVVALVLPDIDKDNFIDYVNAEGQTKKISGVYSADIVKEDGTPWAELGTAYYTFTPDAPSTLWNNYTQYTAGWFYKKGYKSTKLVSGSVKLAAETGFWKGDWSGNAKGVPVLVQVDTEGDPMLNPYYATATDEGGTFSIEVALKNSTDEPNVGWVSKNLTLAELNNYKFVHYYDPATGNKLNINGQFINGGTIRKGDSKWYQLGTRYYTFAKSGVVENWASNLCGWQVWPADYTNKLTIKGAIQKSLEEFKSNATDANEKWEYVPYAFATVTVTVNAVDYAFRVAAESNGQFSLYVNKEDVPSDLTVVIVPDDITDTFKHWEVKNDKNSYTYLSGKYTSAGNIDGSSPISNTGGTTYDLTKSSPWSAKLIYSYTGGIPTGWGDYTWDPDEK